MNTWFITNVQHLYIYFYVFIYLCILCIYLCILKMYNIVIKKEWSFQQVVLLEVSIWKKVKSDPYLTSYKSILFFNWSIIELPCCVNFCCTADSYLYMNVYYIYIHSLFVCVCIYIYTHTFFLYISFHDGLSQDIEYSSLCHTVGPCCLSILYVIVCIC